MTTRTIEKSRKTGHLPANPSVDYPRQDEVIVSEQYAIRVGAPEEAQAVEVSIDQGEWLACRQAAGYWWYDWSGYEGGEHEVIARIITPEGRRVLSKPHEFFVDFRGWTKPV